MNRPSSQYEYMALDDFEELLADKPADEKWELIGGRVVRTPAGVRWQHNRIVGNVLTALMTQLRADGSDCRPISHGFWLEDEALDLACFPDMMVRRGPLPPSATSLDDPVVIIEVTALGGKARDAVEKWAVYQKFPSLRHDVLVERDRAHIEIFDHVGEEWSGVRILDGLEANLDLPAIGVGVPLAEIYRDVIGVAT